MNKIVEDSRAVSAFHTGAAARTISPDLVRSLKDDGAVLLKGVLNRDEMALAREVFDYQLENIAPWAMDRSTPNSRFVVDPINPAVWDSPIYQRLWHETKLVDMAGEILSTPEVWLWYSQIFFKRGSSGTQVERTEWHQDLVYDSIEGDDLLRFWVSFEPLEKEYALEFVRGSHKRGVVYNPGVYTEEAARTANNGKPMPPVPDIEADRSQWEIISWAVEPGDVVAFHPGALHSGGGTKPNGTRRTLTMLLFGRNARYSLRPTPTEYQGRPASENPDEIMRARFDGLQPGDPAWRSTSPRLK